MREDLTNKRFNKLLVTSFCESRKGRKYWNCLCSCGNKTVASTRDLRSSRKKSCGCLEHSSKYTKHNLSHTRIYSILKGMKGRCLNPKNKDYAKYGGRGIKICDEWLDPKNGVLNFFNWAKANGYADNLSIDRINVNGNYSPNNCRWASIKEQSNNTRFNHFLTYKGETKTIKQWSELFGIEKNALRGRIVRGWSIEDALNIPTNSQTKLSLRKITQEEK